MVTVHNEKDNTTTQITYTGTLRDLLIKLNVNPETVLVVRNNEVIIESVEIQDKDALEILSVISGG